MAWKRLIFLFLFYSSISVAEEQELKFKKLLTLNEPWGSTFINDDALLITEKSGKIKLINLLDNNIKELEDNPKLITKFEPLVWLAFIALTAVVGCPVF